MSGSVPSDAVPYKGQIYEDIKQQCLKENAKWEDPEFPAVDSSLFGSSDQKLPFKVEWKRPETMTPNAKLFVGGASRFDLTQGMLDDNWLVAAVASLSQHESLLHQVMPPDQDLDAGIVRFRFWQFGKWTEVCVDDRLPTRNNRLIFVHSPEKNEYWSALLEKAYAKLSGCYWALKGGSIVEALDDFIGGVTEVFWKIPENVFNVVKTAVERSSLLACMIAPKDKKDVGAKLSTGLIKGHIYSITGVNTVNLRGRDEELVRVRNPWGHKEWNSAWSDSSAEWKAIDETEKKRVGFKCADDGEFWMSLSDFTTHFTTLYISNVEPAQLVLTGDTKRWETLTFEGKWIRGVSAGGSKGYDHTFYTNPQYRFKLEGPDHEGKAEILVSLMQKDGRRSGEQYQPIGFCIYQVKDEHRQLETIPRDYFSYTYSAASPSYVNGRSITGRFLLRPDEYVILPTKFKAGDEGEFFLRLFSEKIANAK